MNLELNKIHFGDCLDLMGFIPDGSIDMILCDLPYGKTKNKWDSVIDLVKLWGHYERIIKSNGVIALTGQDKFSARVMLSNEKIHRYNLIWEKSSPTGHLNAKKMPLRSHEDIMIFYKSTPTYNPQKTTGHARKVSTAHHKRNSKRTTNYGDHGLTSYDSTERYPKSVLRFPSDKQRSAIHPTQKPVALFKWFINTYTNEGEMVLDNCSGSGTTAVACIETKRNFICIDNDIKHFNDSIQRVKIYA